MQKVNLFQGYPKSRVVRGDIIPAHSPMISARSDVVGSLLRLPELLAAQKQLAEGLITPGEFKKKEDKAVDQAIALQEEAGLEVATDGEMRR